MNVERYRAMEVEQRFGCAICGGPPSLKRGGKVDHFDVDHDHETGEVRGLLCSGCNTGLGSFRDDPSRLAAAIAYLKRSLENNPVK
jgi:hypothetical protein